MSDDEFSLRMHGAGISAVASGLPAGQVDLHARRIAHRISSRRWKAVDNAAATLERLASYGLQLALVSNFTSDLPSILHDVQLGRYFSCVIVSEIVQVWKPDPRILQLAVERLSREPEECAYIGDHPYDVKCADSAGLRSIWLNPPEQAMPEETACEADYEITSLDELVELFGVR